MLWSDTSPDVNTSEIRCLKPNINALLRKAITFKLVGCISFIYVTSPITPILIGMSQANIISIVMTYYF